jgi:hypothetical protein
MRNRWRIAAFSVLVGLAGIVARAQVQTPARDVARAPAVGTAVLTGTVMTDEAASRPVRRAIVTLTGAIVLGARVTVTDDAGRFSFGGLPAGNLTLSVSKPGYVTTYYGAKRPARGPGTPIAVAEGQRVTANLKMLRGAVITGTVRDPAGQPAVQVSVSVLQYQTIGGERQLQPVLVPGVSSILGTPTDDRGMYRIYGLPPGEYVAAIAPPRTGVGTAEVRQTTPAELQWAERQFQSGALGQAGPPPARGPSVGYARLYYPGTPDPQAATTISLRAGEERSGVDFTVQFIQTARIEGTVVDPDGRPVSVGQVSVLPRTLAVFDPSLTLSMRATVASGRFAVTGIPPGEYTVSVRAAGRAAGPPGAAGPPAMRGGGPTAPALWAMHDVTVAGQDISNLELKLAPGLAVAGRIVFETSTLERPNDLSRFRPSMRSWAAPGGSGVTISVQAQPPGPDGRFAFSGVVPGRYAVSAFGPSAVDGTPVWILKSIAAGGRDVTDVPLELRPGEDPPEILVTFTDKVTEISGMLLDAVGRPAPEVSIVIFSADKAHWTENSRRIRAVRPASDGRFKLTGMPPGEYFLSAVTDYEPGDLTDASFLEQLAAAGYKITLAEGERKVQDLKIAGGADVPEARSESDRAWLEEADAPKDDIHEPQAERQDDEQGPERAAGGRTRARRVLKRVG